MNYHNLLFLTLLLFSCKSTEISTNTSSLTTDQQQIHTIINSTLEFLSGEIGKKRNWEEFTALFTPYAIIGSSYEANGERVFQYTPIQEFVEINGNYYESNDFFEIESGFSISVWNGIANAVQTYNIFTSTENLAANQPELQGMNNYRLVKIGEQWKIQSIIYAQANEEWPVLELNK